jgi:hypothetical protein
MTVPREIKLLPATPAVDKVSVLFYNSGNMVIRDGCHATWLDRKQAVELIGLMNQRYLLDVLAAEEPQSQ